MLEPRARLSALAAAGLHLQGQELGPSRIPPSARGHPGQRARARPGRGGRGFSAQLGLPRLTPQLYLPSERRSLPVPRAPGSASRRHPQRRDRRSDTHGRTAPAVFQPPDSPTDRGEHARVHTPDPGAGLGSDTCDQQVWGPRPPSRQDAPPPRRRPRLLVAPRPRT